jgi:hypothetical protein
MVYVEIVIEYLFCDERKAHTTKEEEEEESN